MQLSCGDACQIWTWYLNQYFENLEKRKLTHPSAAYMRQWTGSALVHIMACRLFGAKPLPEPMLAYCQLDSREQISVKFESEFYHFHSRKCIWNFRLPKCRPFCPGGDEITEQDWFGTPLTRYPNLCWLHDITIAFTVKCYYACMTIMFTHGSQKKWPPFYIHFQIHFLEWKSVYYGQNLIEVYS